MLPLLSFIQSIPTESLIAPLDRALPRHHEPRSTFVRYPQNESDELVLVKVLWTFYEQGRINTAHSILHSAELLEYKLHFSSAWKKKHVHERAVPTTDEVHFIRRLRRSVLNTMRRGARGNSSRRMCPARSASICCHMFLSSPTLDTIGRPGLTWSACSGGKCWTLSADACRTIPLTGPVNDNERLE